MHGSQMMYAIVFMISQACDPALVGLFTPPRPEMGHYEVCTRDDSLETVVAEGRNAAIRFADVEALEPLDAFGSAGAYNRFALVRLYGGLRVRVVHGWRQTAGRFESITLLSPHPNAALTRLEPGTMIITLTIGQRETVAAAGGAERAEQEAQAATLRRGRAAAPTANVCGW